MIASAAVTYLGWMAMISQMMMTQYNDSVISWGSVQNKESRPSGKLRGKPTKKEDTICTIRKPSQHFCQRSFTLKLIQNKFVGNFPNCGGLVQKMPKFGFLRNIYPAPLLVVIILYKIYILYNSLLPFQFDQTACLSLFKIFYIILESACQIQNTFKFYVILL